jgi:hypothetical protein
MKTGRVAPRSAGGLGMRWDGVSNSEGWGFLLGDSGTTLNKLRFLVHGVHGI